VDLARGFLVAYAVQSIPNSRPAKASQYTQQLIQEVENDAKGVENSQLEHSRNRKFSSGKAYVLDFCRRFGWSLNTYNYAENRNRIANYIFERPQLKKQLVELFASQGLPQTRN